MLSAIVARGSALLTVLLVLSTALFSAGAIAERNSTEMHSEQVETSAGHSEESETAEASERTEEAGHAEGTEERQQSEEGEEERLLGVDLESTPLIVLAVAFGLALAAGSALSTLRRRRELLLFISAATLAWAVLDVRELIHQVDDESRAGIAIVAGIVAVLHVASAALAVQLSRRTPSV